MQVGSADRDGVVEAATEVRHRAGQQRLATRIPDFHPIDPCAGCGHAG